MKFETIFFSVCPDQVTELQNLGFSPQDCLQALEKCGGNLDDSALWLTQNAVAIDYFPDFSSVRPETNTGMSTYGVSTQDILNFRLLEVRYLHFLCFRIH